YSASWNTTTYAHNSSHTLVAKAYDIANNLATSSTITTKVADITPPTVSITSPVNNSNVARSSTITIMATASDISGVSKVEFYVNKEVVIFIVIVFFYFNNRLYYKRSCQS
ncbi:Ig-like domain-containing protein, partial [Candidatus Woesebacteria bacterium]|nr:Ig-like domain-containing protein [Candidatus Woesebacteria bacterium]